MRGLRMQSRVRGVLTAFAVAGLTWSSAAAEDNILTMSPKAPSQPDKSHAALSLSSEAYSNKLLFSGHVATLKQLRTGSAPNPWECAWIVWHFSDFDHFYYLALKPNGWELGKRNPKYPGGQRFLATGNLSFAIGSWSRFRIAHIDNKITVTVNNMRLTTFVDSEKPIYRSGRLGIYTEDATVAVDNLTSPLTENFDGYAMQSTTRDGSSIGALLFPFLGYGIASITPAHHGPR